MVKTIAALATLSHRLRWEQAMIEQPMVVLDELVSMVELVPMVELDGLVPMVVLDG